ncbi:unnamed protein product [Adineta ricciae]|uniref:Protein kinase domain-containing protein n=1 Tax=Adineta ricciae TaxID=249248 RepID=A0A814R4G8_ADIRI|nr:unnamed protein product [Adineta ricciae]
MEEIDIHAILQDARYNDTRDKLGKLLIERQIPYFISNDHLKIIEIIGRGSFGKVELVSYKKKQYAHKLPVYNSPKHKDNILGEAIRLTDIREHHPNVQRLYFINLSKFGFLMDYCECGSLDTYVIDDDTSYTLIDVLKWSYQLADALTFIHSKNIMHRDVKLQNILLKDDYKTIVLTDYGSASELGRSLLTNEVGTPITMAPEVFSVTKYTEKCDIYSWAIVFSQLLSKQCNPYEDLKLPAFSLLIKISTTHFRPPKLRNCPTLLEALMYRSWHSDPNERPTLSFIKRVLLLTSTILSKAEATHAENITPTNVEQCENIWMELENLQRLNQV